MSQSNTCTTQAKCIPASWKAESSLRQVLSLRKTKKQSATHFRRSLMSIFAALLSANPVSSRTSSTFFLKSSSSSMIYPFAENVVHKRRRVKYAPRCSPKPTSSSWSPTSPSRPSPGSSHAPSCSGARTRFVPARRTRQTRPAEVGRAGRHGRHCSRL